MKVCELGYEHACGLGQASWSLLKIWVDEEAVFPKLALHVLSPFFYKGEQWRKPSRPHTSPSSTVRKSAFLGSGVETKNSGRVNMGDHVPHCLCSMSSRRREGKGEENRKVFVSCPSHSCLLSFHPPVRSTRHSCKEHKAHW